MTDSMPVQNHVRGTKVWLLQRENYCIFVGGRYRLEWHCAKLTCCYGRFGFTELGPCQPISQEAVKGMFYILGC